MSEIYLFLIKNNKVQYVRLVLIGIKYEQAALVSR